MKLLVLFSALVVATATSVTIADESFCPNQSSSSCKLIGGQLLGTEVQCDITSHRMVIYNPGRCSDKTIKALTLDRAYFPCRAYAGMNVSVQCVEEGSRALYVDGSFAGEGVYRVLNASSSSAATLLQCRNATNHTTAERNLTITANARVSGETLGQCDSFSCDIEHHCCKSGRATIILNPEMSPTASPLVRYFSVLGAGPPSLSWDVVWLNHYPVSLQLEVEEEGYSNGSLTMVMLLRGGWPRKVTTDDVRALVRITAANNFSSHSACFPLVFQSDYQTITVNDSLLRNTTAEASSDAAFHVEFGYSEADTAFHFIQVSLYPSPASDLSNSSCTCELGSRLSLCHCENCSFTIDFQSLEFSALSGKFLYTATIGNVSLNDSGTIVSFSYLRGGGLNNEIQWQGNATLNVVAEFEVTPSSSSSTDTSPPPVIKMLLSVLVSVAGVVVMAAVLMTTCGVWVYRRRKRRMASQYPQMEFVPLTTSSSLSSISDAGTPCTSCQHLPAIQISHLQEHQRILPVGQARTHSNSSRNRNGETHSLDSGVDEEDYTQEWQHTPSHPSHPHHPPPRTLPLPSLNSTGHRRTNQYHINFLTGDLTRTQSESAVNRVTDKDYALHLQRLQKYRIYISYTQSKALWVMEKLKPLIESLQRTEVTLHDFDMIPGKTIPEERLRLILDADKIVIVCSGDYGESEWCDYELQHAIMKQPRLCRGKVIPILTDGCVTVPKIIEGVVPLPDTAYNFIERLATAICPTPLSEV